MSTWWTAYLAGVRVETVPDLVRGWSVPERAVEGAAHTIIGFAARCRLAFAPIETVHDVLEPGSLVVPSQAIISQTTTQRKHGRPSTARWAYWTALLVANTLGHSIEWKATNRQLAALINVLTGQRVSADEVRGRLGRLRREAEAHARAAADILLQQPIERDLTDRAFRKHIRSYMGQDLAASTEYSPMIVHGRLNEAWLQRLVVVRQRILQAVRRHGPLGGDGPLLQLLSIAQLRRGLPLGAPGSVGSVHLDKGLDVAIPTAPDPGGSISVTLLLDKPPYGTALCALPQWWGAWQAASFLPVDDREQPGRQQRHRDEQAGRPARTRPRRQRGGRKPRRRKSG